MLLLNPSQSDVIDVILLILNVQSFVMDSNNESLELPFIYEKEM